MTYIITIIGEDSIYMASDSRMHDFIDREIGGVMYKEIRAISDGIQKTFFLENPNIGIQFFGNGVLPYEGKKFPLSYFIKKLKNIQGASIEENFAMIFNFFKDLSIEGNTGQYVRGIMSAIDGNDKKVCMFNTFDNSFETRVFPAGVCIQNEKVGGNFSLGKSEIIKEIKRRISKKSREKWWAIGGDITLLEITKDSHSFILGFEEDLDNLKWKPINPPKLEKYNLTPDD